MQSWKLPPNCTRPPAGCGLLGSESGCFLPLPPRLGNGFRPQFLTSPTLPFITVCSPTAKGNFRVVLLLCVLSHRGSFQLGGTEVPGAPDLGQCKGAALFKMLYPDSSPPGSPMNLPTIIPQVPEYPAALGSLKLCCVEMNYGASQPGKDVSS